MVNKIDGFTLAEIIVVIATLGIIVVITFTSLSGFKDKVAEDVCDVNLHTVEQMYGAFLLESNHENIIFSKFLLENFNNACPIGGVINYDNGKIKCSIHKDKSEEGQILIEDVPWL